jgi:cytochrome c553
VNGAKICIIVMSIALGAVLSSTACDQHKNLVQKSAVGEVPAAKQREGDPELGYWALLNKPYVTCGVPYRAYKKSAPKPPPFQRIPGRKGPNAKLPYMLTSFVTRDGVALVTSNCLSCHAAYFNGQLVVGLGNEALDFTQDPLDSVESVGVYVKGKAEVAEWRKWADRMVAIAPYMVTDTVGVNPAPNLTFALIAHRDPKTLAWSKTPLLKPPPTTPLPISVPPWWRMKKKHAMFYNAGGRGDHGRIMMAESLVCTDTVTEAHVIDTYFKDIRAYINTLESPAFPFKIDNELAVQGRQVFTDHCTRCHGTYGQHESYPNLVIALEDIGTDPEYALQAYNESDRFIEWFNGSFYGELARAAPARGYIAPPLDGVWATAPYLHNGSVPTLASLLNSSTRPKFWTRSFKSFDYDDKTLGWRYTVLTDGKEAEQEPDKRKLIYDTQLPGYSNQGHTYGNVLTEEERWAVLEYIKTF